MIDYNKKSDQIYNVFFFQLYEISERPIADRKESNQGDFWGSRMHIYFALICISNILNRLNR